VWAAQPVRVRTRALRAIRQAIAEEAQQLAAAVPTEIPGVLHRTVADTLAAEVLPLVEAIRYLEQNAESILAAQREPQFRFPFWLGRTDVTTRRIPLGTVLVVAAGNYPLFLPAVQMLQAIIAGNAVLIKPAPGTGAAITYLCGLCCRMGIPQNLIVLLDETPAAAIEAIRAGVDKVFFTGSDRTGIALLHELADTLTPCVLELSGCDAIFVLAAADLDHAVESIAFALRLNGSATCMAPRRLFVHRSVWSAFIPPLVAALRNMAPVPVPATTASRLHSMLEQAVQSGARLLLNGLDGAPPGCAGATVIEAASPSIRAAREDIFAPLLSLFVFDHPSDAIAMDRECPYALTATIFGRPEQALKLAEQVNAGTVLVNGTIVATADPRAAFGGRKRSGFGVTRGREGLLAMTATQTLITQHSRNRRTYQPLSEDHETFFCAWLRWTNGRSAGHRIAALRTLFAAARRISQRTRS
jgi:acyl-CoA reductase-like NAD-dependent aldehyde dehydrogenase